MDKINPIIESEIEKYPKKLNFVINDFLGASYFIRSKEISANDLRNLNEKIYKSDFEFLLLIICICFFGVIYSLLVHEYTFNLIAIQFLLLVLLLVGFIYYWRKVDILKINKNGLESNKELINWNQIYDYGVYVQSGRPTSYTLLLFLNNQNIKKIDITDINLKHREFLGEMNFFRKNKKRIKNMSICCTQNNFLSMKLQKA